MSRLVSPLKWYGGKCRLVSKLLPFVPEHHTYVEVFAGGASLLFAKTGSALEVINDLDSGVINFYRVIRDAEKFRKFQFLVSLTPFSREEYEICRRTYNDCKDDVDRAHRWFVTNRMCYGGISNSGFGRSLKTGRNGMAINVAGYLSSIHRLPEIADRLMRVQIENLDFRRIVNEYDGPGTFFYLDPPYVLSTRKLKAYRHELTDADHEALVKLLLQIKGKAMLSGYDNPLYQPLESAGWTKHQFKVICRVNNNFTKSSGDGSDSDPRERIESIWLNFDVNGGIDRNRSGL